MKILCFGGGLGNQIYEYAVYLYLKEKYPRERIYGYYNRRMLKEHTGLEIDKHFDVSLPAQPWWANFVVGGLFLLKRIFHFDKLVDSGGNGPVIKNERALFISAYRDNKIYFPETNWIAFKEPFLNEKNMLLLNSINSECSFFIHVRRGDYLSDKYKWLFAGCCTQEYYKKAIELVTERYHDVSWYLFSDDIEWCKIHLNISATAVDWNTGADSYLDMYMMSKCKGGIMANSTFSYWGAYLGERKSLVVYPEKWSNSPYGSSPNIFPNDTNWIAI